MLELWHGKDGGLKRTRPTGYNKEHSVAGLPMIRQPDWSNLRGREFLAQAGFSKAPADFADAHNIEFSRREDDLYYFEGALLRLDDKVDFMLMRYDRSEDLGTTTLCLPYDVSNIQDITEIVSSIARELGISGKEILWERKDFTD